MVPPSNQSPDVRSAYRENRRLKFKEEKFLFCVTILRRRALTGIDGCVAGRSHCAGPGGPGLAVTKSAREPPTSAPTTLRDRPSADRVPRLTRGTSPARAPSPRLATLRRRSHLDQDRGT